MRERRKSSIRQTKPRFFPFRDEREELRTWKELCPDTEKPLKNVFDGCFQNREIEE